MVRSRTSLTAPSGRKVLTWRSLAPRRPGATTIDTHTCSDFNVTTAAPPLVPLAAVFAGTAFTNNAVTTRMATPTTASPHTDRRNRRSSYASYSASSISSSSSDGRGHGRPSLPRRAPESRRPGSGGEFNRNTTSRLNAASNSIAANTTSLTMRIFPNSVSRSASRLPTWRHDWNAPVTTSISTHATATRDQVRSTVFTSFAPCVGKSATARTSETAEPHAHREHVQRVGQHREHRPVPRDRVTGEPRRRSQRHRREQRAREPPSRESWPAGLVVRSEHAQRAARRRSARRSGRSQTTPRRFSRVSPSRDTSKMSPTPSPAAYAPYTTIPSAEPMTRRPPADPRQAHRASRRPAGRPDQHQERDRADQHREPDEDRPPRHPEHAPDHRVAAAFPRREPADERVHVGTRWRCRRPRSGMRTILESDASPPTPPST